MIRRLTYRDYNTGHPWYYLLGGPVRTPKQIKDDTRYSGYKGYRRDQIASADQKDEPQRSAKLRQIRTEVINDLTADITIYRQKALELHRWRERFLVEDKPNSCADIHTSMSLKHNHLVNGFAHVVYLEDVLGKQRDLFGF